MLRITRCFQLPENRLQLSRPRVFRSALTASKDGKTGAVGTPAVTDRSPAAGFGSTRAAAAQSGRGREGGGALRRAPRKQPLQVRNYGKVVRPTRRFHLQTDAGHCRKEGRDFPERQEMLSTAPELTV